MSNYQCFARGQKPGQLSVTRPRGPRAMGSACHGVRVPWATHHAPRQHNVPEPTVSVRPLPQLNFTAHRIQYPTQARQQQTQTQLARRWSESSHDYKTDPAGIQTSAVLRTAFPNNAMSKRLAGNKQRRPPAGAMRGVCIYCVSSRRKECQVRASEERRRPHGPSQALIGSHRLSQQADTAGPMGRA